MREILHVLDVHAPPAKLFAALATEPGLAGWWTTDVEAGAEVGDRIDFRFGDTFRTVMRIVRLDPELEVEWEGVGGDERWLGARFVFTFSRADDDTKLTFRQTYGREISDDDYGRFNFNWGYYLQSLKRFCETGTGVPYGGS